MDSCANNVKDSLWTVHLDENGLLQIWHLWLEKMTEKNLNWKKNEHI